MSLTRLGKVQLRIMQVLSASPAGPGEPRGLGVGRCSVLSSGCWSVTLNRNAVRSLAQTLDHPFSNF